MLHIRLPNHRDNSSWKVFVQVAKASQSGLRATMRNSRATKRESRSSRWPFCCNMPPTACATVLASRHLCFTWFGGRLGYKTQWSRRSRSQKHSLRNWMATMTIAFHMGWETATPEIHCFCYVFYYILDNCPFSRGQRWPLAFSSGLVRKGLGTTLRLWSRITAQETCIFTVIPKSRFFFMHMNGVCECVCATVFYRWILFAPLRATTVVQFANVGPLTPARDNSTSNIG